MSMIERGAAAMEGAMFAPHEFPLDADLHQKYLITAECAIAVMREPSERMLEKLWSIVDGPDVRPEDWWRAMIDAAVLDQPQLTDK